MDKQVIGMHLRPPAVEIPEYYLVNSGAHDVNPVKLDQIRPLVAHIVHTDVLFRHILAGCGTSAHDFTI